MNKQDLQQAKELIARDFELVINEKENVTEEQLFDLLADQIAYLIEYKIDYLLSLLYRLDVEESKINMALSPSAPEPANIELSRLVLERQKQRILTKKHFKQDNIPGWDEF